MHVRRKKIIPALAVAVVSAALLTGAASQPAATTTTSAVQLSGYLAGNPRVAAPGEMVTFVFAETSTWPAAIDWFIQPFHQAGVTITDSACVFPVGNTAGGGEDGYTCEPGLLRPGQVTSLILTTHMSGAPGSTASVKVCAYNGGGPGGSSEPCKTLSVKING